MVLDLNVLALDIAGFVKTFAETGSKARVAFSGPVSDKCNLGCRLLCSGHQRPYCPRAGKRFNELASPHHRPRTLG